MKKIGEFVCDVGSFVLNGVHHSNGIGDGVYLINLVEDGDMIPDLDKFKELCWLDMRNGVEFTYWSKDCHPESAKKLDIPEDWKGVSVKTEDGDIYITKLF